MDYSKIVTLNNLNTVYQDIRNRYDNIEAFYDVQGNKTWDELIALTKVKKGTVYTISDSAGTERPDSIKKYDNVVCREDISSKIKASEWSTYWKEVGGIVAEATPYESGLITSRDQQIGGKKTFVKSLASNPADEGLAEIQIGSSDAVTAGIVNIQEGFKLTEEKPTIILKKGDYTTTITSNTITVGSQGNTNTGKLTISSGDVKAGNPNNNNYLGTLKVGTILSDGSIQEGTGETEVKTLYISNSDLEVKGNTIANNATIGNLTVKDKATVKTLNAEGTENESSKCNLAIADKGILTVTNDATITTMIAESAKVGVLNVPQTAKITTTNFNGSTLSVEKGITATYLNTPQLTATEEVRVGKINSTVYEENTGKYNGNLNVKNTLTVDNTATFNGDLTVANNSSVGTLTAESSANINSLDLKSHNFNANGDLTGKGTLGSISAVTYTKNINTLNLENTEGSSNHNFSATGTIKGNGNLGQISGTVSTKNINELNLLYNSAKKNFSATGNIEGNGDLGVISGTVSTKNINGLNVNSKNFKATGNIEGSGVLGSITGTSSTTTIGTLNLNTHKFTATGDLTGSGSLGTINNTINDSLVLKGTVNLGNHKFTATGDLTGEGSLGTITSTATSNINTLNVNSKNFTAVNNLTGNGSLGILSNTTYTKNINELNLQDANNSTKYDFTATGNLTGKGTLGEITAAKTSNIKEILLGKNTFTANGALTGKGTLGTINNDSSNSLKINGTINLSTYTLNASGDLTISTGSNLGTLNATTVNVNKVNNDKKGTLISENISIANDGSANISSNLDADNIYVGTVNAVNNSTAVLTSNKINPDTLDGGTLHATNIYVKNVNASGNSTSTLTSNVLKPTTLDGGTLHASDVYVKSVNAIGNSEAVLSTNTINLGSAGSSATINLSDNKVQINADLTTTETHDIYAKSFIVASSRKFKENINPTKFSGLETLEKAEVVDFTYIADPNKDPKVGLIAEDCPAILAVPDKTGLDTNNCIGILMKAVQELNEEVKDLKRQLAELKR